MVVFFLLTALCGIASKKNVVTWSALYTTCETDASRQVHILLCPFDDTHHLGYISARGGFELFMILSRRVGCNA